MGPDDESSGIDVIILTQFKYQRRHQNSGLKSSHISIRGWKIELLALLAILAPENSR